MSRLAMGRLVAGDLRHWRFLVGQPGYAAALFWPRQARASVCVGDAIQSYSSSPALFCASTVVVLFTALGLVLGVGTCECALAGGGAVLGAPGVVAGLNEAGSGAGRELFL
ncbi:hypothetical protein Tco_0548789 [Tanacetum coccineum]